MICIPFNNILYASHTSNPIQYFTIVDVTEFATEFVNHFASKYFIILLFYYLESK